jgi:hypothetical protein
MCLIRVKRYDLSGLNSVQAQCPTIGSCQPADMYRICYRICGAQNRQIRCDYPAKSVYLGRQAARAGSYAVTLVIRNPREPNCSNGWW